MFQRNQEILTRLLLERRNRVIARPVSIREILVTHKSNANPDDDNHTGEFAANNFYDENDRQYINRTLAHIESVAEIAAKSHLVDNFLFLGFLPGQEDTAMKFEFSHSGSTDCKDETPVPQTDVNDDFGILGDCVADNDSTEESWNNWDPDFNSLDNPLELPLDEENGQHDESRLGDTVMTLEENSETKEETPDAIAFPEDGTCRYQGSLYKMKADKINAVTRLSFNEYYFYPHEMRGPLSAGTFKKLVGRIEKLASGLPENLHLLLASFPLHDTDGFVVNMVIYVQCGAIPTLDLRAKITASDLEPWYPFMHPWSYCPVNQNQPIASLAAGDGTNATLAVNLGAPILCKTPETIFWTTIDICLDHQIGVALQAFMRELGSHKQPSQFLPEQITHVVTSNSIELLIDHALCNTVTHVDPAHHSLFVFPEDGQEQTAAYGFFVEEIDSSDPDEKSYLYYFATRHIETLTPDVLNIVQNHNAQVVNHLTNPPPREDKTPDGDNDTFKRFGI